MVIISLRTCGVLLVAGMMVMPAIAARWWVKRVGFLFMLSAFFAAIAALFGNFLSVYLGAEGVDFPTGPMITIVSAIITIISLFIGREKGVLLCYFRRRIFSIRCLEENILKILYKNNKTMTYKEMRRYINSSLSLLLIVIVRLRNKMIVRKDLSFSLKEGGVIQAERIIRLHRLWEVYLHEVGFSKNRVHVFAEEIEHVITEKMEEKLEKRLGNPTHCPHKQEIPKSRRGSYDHC